MMGPHPPPHPLEQPLHHNIIPHPHQASRSPQQQPQQPPDSSYFPHFCKPFPPPSPPSYSYSPLSPHQALVFSSQHLQHLSSLYAGLYTHFYAQFVHTHTRLIGHGNNKDNSDKLKSNESKEAAPKHRSYKVKVKPKPRDKHNHNHKHTHIRTGTRAHKHRSHNSHAAAPYPHPYLLSRGAAKQPRRAGMTAERDRRQLDPDPDGSRLRNSDSDVDSEFDLDPYLHLRNDSCDDSGSHSDSNSNTHSNSYTHSHSYSYSYSRTASRYSSAQSSGGSKGHGNSITKMASRRLLVSRHGNACHAHTTAADDITRAPPANITSGHDESFITTTFAHPSSFLGQEKHEHANDAGGDSVQDPKHARPISQHAKQRQQRQQDPLAQNHNERDSHSHDSHTRHVHNATGTPRRDPRDPAAAPVVPGVAAGVPRVPVPRVSLSPPGPPPLSVAVPNPQAPSQSQLPTAASANAINHHHHHITTARHTQVHTHTQTQTQTQTKTRPKLQPQVQAQAQALLHNPHGPLRPLQAQAQNIPTAADSSYTYSRRHKTNLNTHESSAFMYDESFAEAEADGYGFGYGDANSHAYHQHEYPSQPERFLDETLGDPCRGGSDDEADEYIKHPGDSSMRDGDRSMRGQVSHSHAGYARSATPVSMSDFSREHTPAEFAKFIGSNSTSSSAKKLKAAKKAAAVAAESDDPQYTKFVNAMAGIYNLTDQQLEERFVFEQEIGFGNWGSVWQCRLRDSPATRSSPGSRLGRAAAMNGGLGAAGRVAVKLAHRGKEATNTQRVHALWHEMKIIRSLRHDTHPSIIEFEAFVITPGYALIVMPFLSHLIELKIPVERARPYFRALASAVGYLHERGITHNDIKPANIVMNYNDVPVLVDFGFAKKHELGSPGRFLSTVQMGTPEYLDPQRVVGQPHDERASDVWSLGVTFYEILIGRTPFEKDESEVFSDEDLAEYWHRTRAGRWLGEWEMPPKMESLLRYMICPDPIHRITALQAYHHPGLQPSKESLNPSTPHFVREAYQYEPDTETTDAYEEVRARKLKNVKSDVGVRKKKRNDRVVTPLGESIKQHTSAHELRQGATPSNQKPKTRKKATVTHKRVTEMKENKAPRVSESEAVHRPVSAGALLTSAPDVTAKRSSGHLGGKRSSERLGVNGTFGDLLASPTPAKSREEAMLRTMRHLEGNKGMETARQTEREVAARHEVIPQKSFESAATREEAVALALKLLEGGGQKSEQNEKSDGRLATVPLDSSRPHTMDGIEMLAGKPVSELRRSAASDNLAIEPPSTPKRNSRVSTAPLLDVNISTGTIFPPSLRSAPPPPGSLHGSPLRGQGREAVEGSPARRAKQSTAPDAVGQKEDNLDLLADWARTVDQYVEAARKARAEGRPEPPMPPLIEEQFATMQLHRMSPVALLVAQAAQAEFGSKPDSHEPRQKFPERTSRHRGTVSGLFRLNDKAQDKQDKPQDNKPHEKPQEKAQALRRMVARIPTRKSEIQLTPSPHSTLVERSGDEVEILRTDKVETLRNDRNDPHRKSRGDLRDFHIRASWRRSNTSSNLLSPPVNYEALAPPAADHTGEVHGARMPKPSSMVSLRDKARALLGHQDKEKLAHKASQSLPRSTKSAELLRERESRPQTPGAQSVFKERKGLFKLFKRVP